MTVEEVDGGARADHMTGVQRELEERDAMITGLHLSSVTSYANGSPFVRSPEHGSPGTNQAPLRRPQVQT